MIGEAYWGKGVVGQVSRADESAIILSKNDYVAAIDCGELDSYTFPGGEASLKRSGLYRITDSKRSALRHVLETPPLPEGRYEARVRRVDPNSDDQLILDETTLNEFVEVIDEDVAHINTALLALKIKMDEQISGLPKVTAEVGGRVIHVYDRAAGEWTMTNSRNPAWITYDAMTNATYGACLLASRLNFDTWLEWAEFCDKENLTFDGVIDGESNLWEATKLFLRCGRAQLIRAGTRYSVAIERAADPVMVFNTSNILEGTFRQDWTSTSERANEIELTYTDIEDDYKTRTIRVVDEAAIERGDPQRTSSVTMPGIVEEERAYREAWLMLNMNRYLRQSVVFSAHLDAIACTVGDVVLVQHDQPVWGMGGKFATGSTTTVAKLDRPVKMESGKQHKLLVVFPALKIADTALLSKVGKTLILSGQPTKATRIKVGGVEQQIRYQAAIDAGTYSVQVDEDVTANPGAAVELWRTDAIEERDVIFASGEVTSLQLTSALPAAPSQFMSWTFGHSQMQRKPFRVTAISGFGMEDREISALEYNDTIYTSKPKPTNNMSGLTTTVGQTTITSLYEELELIGTVLQPYVVVELENDSSIYGRSEVQVSVDGAPWKTVGSSASRVRFPATEGTTLKVRAVAFSILGKMARPESAKIREIAVLGKQAPPADVKGLTVRKRLTDLVVEWEPNAEPDIAGYELREGISWSSGKVILTDYMGTMHITDKDAAGTYYYHIRAKDTSGNYSLNPTTYKLALTEPEAPRDFDIVQSGDQLVFVWRMNSEVDIAGYELREGDTWSQSKLVATNISNNRFTLPVAGNQDRRFLIKSIASPGIYSATATYFDVAHRDAQTRNVVKIEDHQATNYPGSLVNMVRRIDGTGIEMAPNVRYGDYTFKVQMPAVVRARNVPSYKLKATLVDGETWAAANWSWESIQAGRAWQPTGDLINVAGDMQIAIKLSGPRLDGVVDRWTFDSSVTSAKGVNPSTNIGVKYAQGRFFNGMNISQMTNFAVSVSIPATFSMKFWFRPSPMDGLRLIWRGTGEGGSLELLFDSVTSDLVLREQRTRKEVRSHLAFVAGEAVLVVITQSTTDRMLMYGVPGSNPVVASEKFPPIGPFTTQSIM